MILSYAH